MTAIGSRAGRRLVLGGVEIPRRARARGPLRRRRAHARGDRRAARRRRAGRHRRALPRQRRALARRRLDRAAARAVGAGRAARVLQIVNVDATVVMEAPKLGAAPRGDARAPRRSARRSRRARVNVKATTGEGIGFVGRGEGVAALAVATCSMAEPAPHARDRPARHAHAARSVPLEPREPGQGRDLRLRTDGLRPHPRRQRAAVRGLQPAQALPRARGLRGDARRQRHRRQRQDLRRRARAGCRARELAARDDRRTTSPTPTALGLGRPDHEPLASGDDRARSSTTSAR